MCLLLGITMACFCGLTTTAHFFANFLLTDSGSGSSSGIGMYYFQTVDCINVMFVC